MSSSGDHGEARGWRVQPASPDSTRTGGACSTPGAPPSAPPSQAARGALIVLDTLSMTGPLARRTLAHVLVGEPSTRASRFAGLRNFGKLIGLWVREIDGLLQQMLALGLLEELPGAGPFGSSIVVALTHPGQEALRTRAAIPVNLRTVTPEEAAMARAQQEAGSSVLLTLRLLE